MTSLAPVLTRSDRQRRRHEIAEHVAASRSVESAAAYFGVSIQQVWLCCREHGVKCGQSPSGRTLRVIADLLHTDLTQAAIARRHGLSEKRVQVIARQAREAGILVCAAGNGVVMPAGAQR